MGTLREHEEMVSSAHDLYAVGYYPRRHRRPGSGPAGPMHHLRVLILDYQQITDLLPLASLPLEYLSLTGNAVSNLISLSGCWKLQTMDGGKSRAFPRCAGAACRP